MENPRSRVTIRRHASLPDPRCRSTFLRTRPRNHTFRTNPYVGWFRHSPSSEGAKLSVKTNVLKDSPYVGWFRHAPPSSFLASCYAELAQELVSSVYPKCHGDVFQLSDLISGHLKGGSGKHSTSLPRRDNFLVAHHVLHRLSTWLMTPFREEEFEASPKQIECDCAESTSSEEDDDDNKKNKKDTLKMIYSPERFIMSKMYYIDNEEDL